MNGEVIIEFILQFIPYSTTLLLGSLGEMITEKSGNLNLGTPGIMATGAIGGVSGAFFYTKYCPIWGVEFSPLLSVIITIVCCMIASLMASLIYSFLTITLKANQNVTGLALTTFGLGISNFLGSIINERMGGTGVSAFPETGVAYKTPLPFADDLGVIGKVLFSYGFMTYFAIALAIVVAIIISKTRVGLNLRAVGENPATADAAGISVNKYKYFATCIGGVISGLGGIYHVMSFNNGSWQNGSIDTVGWLAVALVIFAVWKPIVAIFGAIIFAALYIVGMFLSAPQFGITPSNIPLLEMLPYLATVIVLIFVSIRNKKENQPPASLGVNYFREER